MVILSRSRAISEDPNRALSKGTFLNHSAKSEVFTGQHIGIMTYRNHDTYRGKILQSYNGAFSVGFLVASF